MAISAVGPNDDPVPLSPQIPSLTVQVGQANTAPIADAGGPYTVSDGDTVMFDGSATQDDGTIDLYVWDFGDGSAPDSTGAMVTHVYDSVGTYTAVLTVTDDGGLSATDSTMVTVRMPGSGGPAVVGVWKDTSGAEITAILPGNEFVLELSNELPGTSLNAFQGVLRFDPALIEPTASADLDLGASDVIDQFTGNITVPGEVSLLTFTISPTPGSGPQGLATITFNAKALGTVLPTFQVDVATDFDNNNVALDVDIPDFTVGTPPPAGLKADAGGIYSAAPGTPVTLDGSASTGGIEAFIWTFGDGSPADSSGATVSHTYATVGTYEAVLTVRDTVGDMDADTAVVNVTTGGGVSTAAWRSVWVPDSASNGSTVRLQVSSAPNSTLRAAKGLVTFDPAVLQFDSAKAGAFLDFLFSATPQGHRRCRDQRFRECVSRCWVGIGARRVVLHGGRLPRYQRLDTDVRPGAQGLRAPR